MLKKKSQHEILTLISNELYIKMKAENPENMLK